MARARGAPVARTPRRRGQARARALDLDSHGRDTRAGSTHLAVAGLAVVVAFAALGGLKAAHAAVDALSTSGLASVGLVVGGSPSISCVETTITALAQADSWVDEDSAVATKGSDSILSVDGGSLNVDTGLASGRARALVRFQLPQAIPDGCVLESARLQLFSSEESAGAKVEVARLASAWSEGAVSWSNHPQAIGDSVTSWSRDGYMQWNVTAHVEAMLEAGNHGFLIRDAAEASEAGGGGHGFYSREKGENPGRLVIRFAPPPSDEPPGPPAPPEPATVACGQVLVESTLVTNDLLGCPGDGLVIGAPRIIVDLGGHTIDGVGLGSGVRNDGYASVTVRNGTVQEFDYGVHLLPETELNLVESMMLRRNEVGAVELFDVAATEVRGNVLNENGGGISLVSGTSGAVVAGNSVTANGKAGLLVRDSDRNRLEDNSVSGGGDLGVALERATGNTLVGNTVSDNSDGGIELRAGSHGNRVESNTVTGSGDHGILVDESDGNELISNTSHFMSDSGITLESANDGVVRGNDVRLNTGGLQVDGSSRNVIEANDASNTSGIGIELGGGSLENSIVGNVAGGNASTGILIADDAADPVGAPVPGLGNVLVRNVADGNRADGILVAKGGHTIAANVARNNTGWGINAAPNSIDGGLNVASGNHKPEQCTGVVCKVEWNPPKTTITDRPADMTNSTSASFRFTGSDDTTPPPELRFECRLDSVQGAAWATCSSPRSYAGLATGSHVFEVRAIDRADNIDPTPARHAWTIDATPPETTIQAGPDGETASTAASFVFSADEQGANFACSLDGGPFESCASPILYAEVTEGRHEFRVFATDTAGNGDATPASHIWSVDTTAPETMLEEAPAELTKSTSATFSFSADEDGASFACSLDGAPFDPCESPVDYSGLTDGDHTFEVHASDRVGNADATPARHAWTVDTVAPETTIGSGPAALTNSAQASFVFSSEPGAGFQCRLDQGDWHACSSPQGYAALADGAHAFQVRATDGAGNDGSPASHGWTVDTVAPETTIGSGPAALTNSAQASFVFSSEPGAGFQCRLDLGDWHACSSPQGYAALADGAHSFDVRATDAAGNTDTSPAVHNWTVDTVAPETTIDSGPAALTNSAQATFRFSSEPGAGFQCRLDEGDWHACSSPQGYSALADGTHAFQVRASDAAGNVDGSPASYSWTVDTVAPETTVHSGPAALTNSAQATFRFSSEPGAGFQCRLDQGDWHACSSPQGYSALADGAHTFQVRASDAAGNTDASPARYSWTVDTVAPETTIGSGPAALTNSAQATFVFSSEPGAGFQCRLDQGDWHACSSPQGYAALADGVHAFQVRATDAAGNTDTSPAHYSWTVDTVAPETTIDSAPADPSNDSSPSFAFSSESGAGFQCRLDQGDWHACSSPQGYAALADGAHSFDVRATDAAGNTDTSPAHYSWTVDTVAPETTIDSAPADPSNDSSPSFAFSSESGAGFQCRLDQGDWHACSSPQGYAALADGTHSFDVRATDAANNTDTSPARNSWTVDTVAPETTIDSGPADPSSDRTAELEFSSSEAGSSFECQLDTRAWAPCSSPQTYGALDDGAHGFQVRASDAAGNVDPTPAIYTWTVEESNVTPPDTTITSAPPALTSGTSASFAFSASESGSTFECSLDEAAFAACSSPRVYSGLAAGAHVFRVRASDAAGNVDASPASHSWTVDTVAPQTTITSAPPALTSGASASFAFSASESGSTFECSLDEAAFAACSSPRVYSGLAAGAHVFRVRAIDAAGNVDVSPASHSWTVDTVAPQTTIDSGPPATTSGTSASFAFSASESGSTFECSLDEAAFAACSSPREYTGLAAGGHVFRVRAKDAAGNVDASPASHSWTIQAPGGCAGSSTVTAGANADSWVLESSASSNYGNDSVVKVDTKAGANARALFRFALPAIPAGCQVIDARLRLYASSYKQGRTLQALRLGASWTESGVTWSNQPLTSGAAATAVSPSASSYVQWSVAPQVQAMYSSANHGFLIRDSVENGNGLEQAFHSREKAPDNPPQLVVTFG